MKRLLISALLVSIGVCPLVVSRAFGQTSEPASPIQQEQVGPPAGENHGPQYSFVAPTLILPEGTLVQVRLTQLLSSDHNKAGDGFTAELDQPLIAQGWVVARRGQSVIGQVTTAQYAGRVKGVSQLAVQLTELILVDGQQVPIRTQLAQSSAGTSEGRDAQGVGTATGIGAIIGAAAGGGKGAAIGAAAGAAAGIAGVLTTRGRPAELYPETLLTFRLEAPVNISTAQSQQAFHPVTQADYSDRSGMRNPPRNFRVGEAYPPAPYYYYEPYYYYPGWYYGYGFGPRFYVYPRNHFGGGFHRHH
jgi:hypothetical protein